METTVKMIGPFMVQRMLTDGCVVFTAWEPDPEGLFGNHGTVTRDHDVWFGEIGTRETAGVELMPTSSPARSMLVDIDRAVQAVQARGLIVAAFPEAASGQPRWGCLMHEIELEVS